MTYSSYFARHVLSRTKQERLSATSTHFQVIHNLRSPSLTLPTIHEPYYMVFNRNPPALYLLFHFLFRQIKPLSLPLRVLPGIQYILISHFGQQRKLFFLSFRRPHRSHEPLLTRISQQDVVQLIQHRSNHPDVVFAFTSQRQPAMEV